MEEKHCEKCALVKMCKLFDQGKALIYQRGVSFGRDGFVANEFKQALLSLIAGYCNFYEEND